MARKKDREKADGTLPADSPAGDLPPDDLPSEERVREVLHAVWFWDYRTWENVEPHVAGSLADMLRRNLSDEEVECARELVSIRVESVEALAVPRSFRGDTDADSPSGSGDGADAEPPLHAEAAAIYRFRERSSVRASSPAPDTASGEDGGQARAQPDGAADVRDEPTEERIVWIFRKENGVWKAAGLRR